MLEFNATFTDHGSIVFRNRLALNVTAATGAMIQQVQRILSYMHMTMKQTIVLNVTAATGATDIRCMHTWLWNRQVLYVTAATGATDINHSIICTWLWNRL